MNTYGELEKNLISNEGKGDTFIIDTILLSKGFGNKFTYMDKYDVDSNIVKQNINYVLGLNKK